MRCEAINKEQYLGVRPLCPCCGGGVKRGRAGQFAYTKAKSKRKSAKARKPRVAWRD